MLIPLDCRRKGSGVPILSRVEIDQYAKRLVKDFDASFLGRGRPLDVEEFTEFYAELDLDYQDLSPDGSILGMMVFDDCKVPVYDLEANQIKPIYVNQGTVIIDNRLLEDKQRRRGRFTLLHEVGHWLCHQPVYSMNGNQLSLFDDLPDQNEPMVKCRSDHIECTASKLLSTDEDFMEWQAEALAAALLMPKKAFADSACQALRQQGIPLGYRPEQVQWYQDQTLAAVIRRLSDQFDVSMAAVRIRLANLGLVLDSNAPEQATLF